MARSHNAPAALTRPAAPRSATATLRRTVSMAAKTNEIEDPVPVAFDKKAGIAASWDGRTGNLAASKQLHPDSKAYKQLRRALCFRQMLSERSKVVSKLDEIEKQKKQIQDDYKARHSSANNAANATAGNPATNP